MENNKLLKLSEAIAAIERGEEVEAYLFDEYWFLFDPTDYSFEEAKSLTFRIKPKPLELWVTIWDDNSASSYRTKEEAFRYAGDFDGDEFRRVAVHMREVIE